MGRRLSEHLTREGRSTEKHTQRILSRHGCLGGYKNRVRIERRALRSRLWIGKTAMMPNIHTVTDAHLPVLDVFRRLVDRDIKRREGLFVAEGVEAVRCLLQSDLGVHSLPLSPLGSVGVSVSLGRVGRRPSRMMPSPHAYNGNAT